MNQTFQSRDFIALLVIILFGIFRMTGHNGALDPVIMLIIGYYFAKREEAPLTVRKDVAQEIVEKNQIVKA